VLTIALARDGQELISGTKKIAPLGCPRSDFHLSPFTAYLGDSMKTEIPQHKLHGDRIAQKWAILLCSGTKGIISSLLGHSAKMSLWSKNQVKLL
jgi:hypothetical protein